MEILVMIKTAGSKRVVLCPLNSATDCLLKAVHSVGDAQTIHVHPCQELNLIWTADLAVRIDATTNGIASSISEAEVSVGRAVHMELSISFHIYLDLF